MLKAAGRAVADFATAEAFLARDPGLAAGCLVIDVNLPGRSGIDLLRAGGNETQVVMLSDVSDATLAVEALRAGAADFLEKPVNQAELLSRIDRAIGLRQELTARQREILELVLAGQPSKMIAKMLGISPRTVDVHRAAIMHKTGAASMAHWRCLRPRRMGRRRSPGASGRDGWAGS